MFDPEVLWNVEKITALESIESLLIHNWQEFPGEPGRKEIVSQGDEKIKVVELANFPEYYLG